MRRRRDSNRWNGTEREREREEAWKRGKNSEGKTRKEMWNGGRRERKEAVVGIETAVCKAEALALL